MLDGIYLSGWEYNRLLQADPFVPRNSALPAEILWNGAAPLWLFRTIYCTAEALDNEWAAYEMLGWPTGWFFTELENRGVIKRVDWSALPDMTRKLVRKQHRQLESQYPPSAVRDFIKNGQLAELDVIKNALIAPILVAHNCASAITPNSLRNWIPPSQPTPPEDPASGLLRQIAIGVSGYHLCSRPDKVVPASVAEAQRRVEAEYQRPMIPDLLSGDGLFSGRYGYEQYLRNLERHRAIYQPINDCLEGELQSNLDNLLRLREVAGKYLWTSLHGEWLPALQRGESPDEVLSLIRGVIRHPRISRLLTVRGKIAVVVASAAAGGLVGGITHALQTIAGLPQSLDGIAAGVVGGVAGKLGTAALEALGTSAEEAAKDIGSSVADAAASHVHERRDRSLRNLTLFYEKASTIGQAG